MPSIIEPFVDRPVWFVTDARKPQVDMGRSPALLGAKIHPVLVGVDGRVTGTFRRDPGNSLWTILISSFHGEVYQDGEIVQAVPLTVVAGNSFKSYAGLLMVIKRPDGSGGFTYRLHMTAESSDGGAPETAGFALDWDDKGMHAAVRGKFIYVMSPEGTIAPQVIWLESGSFRGGIWRTQLMGTQIFTRTALEFVNADRAGISIAGQYQFHWRLVDTNRSRHTRLSIPAVVEFPEDKFRAFFEAPDLSEDEVEERKQYNRWECWGTTSTLDVNHAAGGRTFFVDSWDVDPDFVSGATPYFVRRAFILALSYEDDDQQDQSNIGDAGMAVSEEYDFAIDDASRAPPPAERIAVYQDITVLASGEKPSAGGTTELTGNVVLRWSPSHRLAPEEFPEANNFPTKITRGKAAFLEVSEYLYILGDGPYYRMQRRGSFVEILQMGAGQTLVNPEAACVVGNRIFAVMEHGAVLIDPVTGAVRDLMALDRVLRDRWFHDNAIKGQISCAYDNRMKAIFVQSGLTEETIILWTKTGMITVREDARFFFVRQVEHADGTRAMLLTRRANRIVQPFAFPEASPLPQSMYGFSVGFNMNRKVTARRTGTHSTVLTLDGAAFDPDLDLVGMSTRVLSGPLAGTGYAITESTPFPERPRITVSDLITSNADIVGSYISLGAVPFRVVGGPIGTGEPMTTLRKSVEGARAVVSRFRGDLTYLNAKRAVLRAGVVSYEALSDGDVAAITFDRGPVSFVLNNWVPRAEHAGMETVLPSRENSRLSVSNPAVNHGPLEASGAFLFPYVWSDVGNLNFELHEFAVSGTIGPSEFIEDVPDE